MTERKRTYQSKTKTVTLRRLAPISAPAKSEDEMDLSRQDGSMPTEKIELLNRLIKHLKTL